jgi:mRNA-degrading endonuclease RelE of RelBE toxin-antitoxin system
MNWTVRLSKEAAKQLQGIPADRAKQLRRRLGELRTDPFQGDVKPLHGKEWQGWYRKRVGRYRIIFTLDHSQHTVAVAAILLRDEGTYR